MLGYLFGDSAAPDWSAGPGTNETTAAGAGASLSPGDAPVLNYGPPIPESMKDSPAVTGYYPLRPINIDTSKGSKGAGIVESTTTIAVVAIGLVGLAIYALRGKRARRRSRRSR